MEDSFSQMLILKTNQSISQSINLLFSKENRRLKFPSGRDDNLTDSADAENIIRTI